MIFIDCAQGEPAWHAARTGVCTASRFKDACDFLKSGKPTQKNLDYAYDIAIEMISGETSDDIYITQAMRAGMDREPFARLAYEEKTGNLAEESGIVLTDDRLFGYSTDGFVGADGLIEIKCLSSSRKIIEMLETGDISDYEHQIQGGMWITGRKWCDFIMYVPKLESIGKNLFIKRIERNDEFIDEMVDRLMDFSRRVDSHVKHLKEKAA